MWTCVCHNSCYSQDLVTHAHPLTLSVPNMQQKTRDSDRATVETRPHVKFQSSLTYVVCFIAFLDPNWRKRIFQHGKHWMFVILHHMNINHKHMSFYGCNLPCWEVHFVFLLFLWLYERLFIYNNLFLEFFSYCRLSIFYATVNMHVLWTTHFKLSFKSDQSLKRLFHKIIKNTPWEFLATSL